MPHPSKLYFSPTLGGERAEQEIYVGVKDPDRSAFYVLIDPDAAPARSLYLGFWLWMPMAQDCQKPYPLLRGAWDSDGYEIEEEDQTLYVGQYLSHEECFPTFEAFLDKLVGHVISGLTSINFAESFGPRFRKVRSLAISGRSAPLAE